MTEKRLADRVAVITGASRGLGRAAARAIAAEGAHVVLLARTVGGLEEADDEIRSAGGSATLVPIDLAELDRIDALGPQLLERFGRADILVGNAGLLGTLGPITHHDAAVGARAARQRQRQLAADPHARAAAAPVRRRPRGVRDLGGRLSLIHI